MTCGYTSSDGTFVSGVTTAHVTALLLSRHQVTQGGFRNEGAWALPARPLSFASDQAHYFTTRAAAGLGIGEQSIIKVSTDQQFRINATHLNDAMEQAMSQLPLMVVVTAGTTSTGRV